MTDDAHQCIQDPLRISKEGVVLHMLFGWKHKLVIPSVLAYRTELARCFSGTPQSYMSSFSLAYTCEDSLVTSNVPALNIQWKSYICMFSAELLEGAYVKYTYVFLSPLCHLNRLISNQL